MDTKIIFIVPYYGTLPEYFKMWLLSVAYNPTIDFLLVTDIEIEQELPQNVKLLKWSWQELLEKIQKPFDFKVNVNTPYHLCDFKPAYGIIFQEYIKEYAFWGNCDIDQIFGDVRKFMTEDILQSNDIIGYLGHFTLHRNKEDINKLFMKEGALFDYKEVFSHKECYAFDEITGLKRIVLKNKISHCYDRKCFADIQTAHKQLKISGDMNYRYQFFYWEQGKVFRTFIEGETVKIEEYMYVHFQKKRPIPDKEINKNTKSFYIFADRFENRNIKRITRDEIIKKSYWRGKIYDWLEEQNWKRRKLIEFIKMSKDQRHIKSVQLKHRIKFDKDSFYLKK